MSDKFELGLYCLGNGITVCNRAVEQHGEYKHIAHISNGGNIKLYVSESYIPVEAMEKIRQTAEEEKRKFQADFLKRDILSQYGEILDNISTDDFLKATRDKRPLEEKIIDLRELYFSIA